MKRMVKSSRMVAAASDRIAEIENRIKDLEDFIRDARYQDVDPEELIDAQVELAALKEQLNFAWQDDEAEYNYAVQQQEFNPDGSLKFYGSTDIKAATGDIVIYCQYLQEDAGQDVGIRSMTVTRPSLKDALVEMLDHIELGSLNIEYDELDDYSDEDLIERIEYVNSEGPDYILYLENKTTKEVYIDTSYPEENY